MDSTSSQQFCVRWNSHLGSLGAAFPQLLAGQRFVDVTLACEGHQLHCHRLVLAACSTYFESLLDENPCKHPIIILPRDIKLWEIQALVDFMYKGEVNVSQAGLSDLLKCAEILQIRGLCGSDAALNLNQVNSTTTTTATTTAAAATTSSAVSTTQNESQTAVTPNPSLSLATQSSSIIDRSETIEPTSPTRKRHHQQSKQNKSTGGGGGGGSSGTATSQLSVSQNSASSSSGTAGNVNSTKKRALSVAQQRDNIVLFNKVKSELQHSPYRTSTPNRTVSKIEPIEVSLDDEVIDDDDDSINPSNEKTAHVSDDSFSGKYLDYLEGAKSEEIHHLTQTEQQQQQRDQEQLAMASSSSNPLLSSLARATTSSNTNNSSSPTNTTYLDNNSNHCDYNRNANIDESHHHGGGDDDDKLLGENYHIVENPESLLNYAQNGGDVGVGNNRRKSSQNFSNIDVRRNRSNNNNNNNTNNCSSNFRGNIRVKSNENLFENFQRNKLRSKNHRQQQQSRQSHQSKPTSSMSARNSKDYSERLLPASLRFDRKSMTIYLKSMKEQAKQLRGIDEAKATTALQSPTNDFPVVPIKTELDIMDENNFESIICSPNVMELSYNDDDDDDHRGVGEDDDDDDDGGGEAAANPSSNILDNDFDDIRIDDEIMYGGSIGTGGGGRSGIGGDDDDCSPNIPNLFKFGDTSSSDQENNQFGGGVQIYDINGRPMDLAMAQFLANKIDEAHSNGTLGIGGVGLNRSSLSNNENDFGGLMNSSDEQQQPSLSSVVLRNPRSNQPRTYSNDALYAALMDVKAGESIYRASQIHKVPRKTLRNWMKRWHIKSAYPMPRQLKQAAEKKKRIQQLVKISNNEGDMNGTGGGGGGIGDGGEGSTMMMASAAGHHHREIAMQNQKKISTTATATNKKM